MTTYQIFCPNNHLVFEQDTCPECGWVRPPQAPRGSLLWEPLRFSGGIGGPSHESFYRPGVMAGRAVFPLRSGALVGINGVDGEVAWQTDASPELFPRHLYPYGDRLLAVVSDHRAIDQAQNGYLACIDPRNGEMQKAWEGYGFTMTEPSFSVTHILLRTAKPKLVALNRKDVSQVVWETELMSYKPIPPLASSELVFAWDSEISNEHCVLKAFSLERGKLAWQARIQEIDCPPLICHDLLVYRTGRRLLSAVTIQGGKQTWQRKYERIYSAPAFCGGKLFQVVRGNKELCAPDHYCLECLDPASGETEWQVAIGMRAQEIVCLPNGSLLLGMGDANLAICSSQDGEKLWHYSMGSEKVNRVQTHLLVADGVIWVGTYEGVVAAISISEDEPLELTSDDYLKNEDYEGAAAALALEKKLGQSAQLYLEKLNQPQKALVLYEYLQDAEGQIQALLRMDDKLSVARLYDKGKKLGEAARFYEEAGETRKAMQLHKQLGNQEEFTRLRSLIPLALSDIESLEEEGKFVEAGDAALKIKDYRKAVDLYQKAGEQEMPKLLDALVHYCNQNPEEKWALFELSNTARRLGQFHIQAEAFEKLKEFDQAAHAYYHAALQLEETDATNIEQIVHTLEKARNYFKSEGLTDEIYVCIEKIRKYRRIPYIQISGNAAKVFRECEWNTLFLTVKNIGYGRADEISFEIPGNRFEIDEESFTTQIERLAASREKQIEISVRPQTNQVGEEVPLHLIWKWKDKFSNSYSARTTVKVTVISMSDLKADSTPLTIQAENYYAGNDYHRIYKGDILNMGGQKRDTVNVGQRERSKLKKNQTESAKPLETLIGKCPYCHLPVEKDAHYCDFCGNELDQQD